MCLMTKIMDRVTFVTEAAGQVYKQTAKFVYLGATVCKNADLLSSSTCTCYWPTYVSDDMACHSTTSPRHRSGSKVRMLTAEVVETMLYKCVTWSPTVAHLAILRTAHHRLLLRCIGWKRKRRDGHHMLSYADALAKTGCQNIETTVRKHRILFAGFVARMGNERVRCLGKGRRERVTPEGKNRT